MIKTDLIVIGAGPAGYVSAIRAAQLGLQVAVVEKEYLGGVCLNVGCIPSKSLLKNADLAYTLTKKAKDFGISFDNLQLDYAAAVKRSRRVSKRLTKGVEFLLKKNKISLFTGSAEFVDANTLKVTGAEGEEQIKADNIIIATGARPFIIPGVEVDGKQVVTYKEAILQETLPKSVVIIGAGAIGVEFATIWNSYGVPVTIVEMMDRVAPNEDPEVSAELEKSINKFGIKTLTTSKVSKVETLPDTVNVSVEGPNGEEVLSADQVLLAASFIPNSNNLGLENIGVDLDRRGFIEVDDRMATNVPGIWAIGDVTGKLMLAHAGMAMGTVCAEAIAGKSPEILNYQNMPKATYCHPQVASFGMTEEQAQNAGYDVVTGKFNFQANGKALGLSDYSGWVKIVVDKKSSHILGAHMIGPEVTELLPELTLAQANGLTSVAVGHNIHAHPTLSEVLHEAAKAVTDEAIHA
ncbi:MAG: dihydrolipoyl dehydrogenase [Chloroflexota bacterium]|nr:MAG: dihydrolipoyl dehydrogenase [Chloroflexota bacterium]HDD62673.1 dihydrolipoyl dehydrogenase [Chloroflexota bacterium]